MSDRRPQPLSDLEASVSLEQQMHLQPCSVGLALSGQQHFNQDTSIHLNSRLLLLLLLMCRCL